MPTTYSQPTASPQTLRPAAEALRHHYYVVTSTPRDNASIFDPIGMTVAQTTESAVLVHEVDLSYAILHWSEALDNGRALTQRFGDKVGYVYSTREDTGVFWSNDAARTIRSMVAALNLREMPEEVGRSRQLQEKARLKPVSRFRKARTAKPALEPGARGRERPRPRTNECASDSRVAE